MCAWGGYDQPHEKIKVKKFEKGELSSKSLPNNKNDNNVGPNECSK